MPLTTTDLAAQPSGLERALLAYGRQFPFRKGKMRVVNSLWRRAVGQRPSLRIAKLNYGDFTMRCDLEEILQRQFYFFGTYFVEEAQLRCWQRFAADAPIIADVGANAGIYSLAALAVKPSAIVHAFEPTPEIADRLRATCIENGLQKNLFVHECAISNETGTAKLLSCRGELGANEGMNYLATSGDPGEYQEVETRTLDKFCTDARIERVDLMKMDIQGHEYLALLGARELINTGRMGDIFMELNWAADGAGPCSATMSLEMLQSAGYRFSEIGPRLNWRTAGDWLRPLGDILASPHRWKA